MPLAISRELHEDWGKAMGQLNTEMHHWAESTGNLSKYTTWSNVYHQVDNYPWLGMSAEELARHLRGFTSYTQKMMAQDWWEWIASTTRGALVSIAEGLDVAAELAKAAGEAAAEGSAKLAEIAGKGLFAILKPWWWVFAIAGSGLGLYLYVKLR